MRIKRLTLLLLMLGLVVSVSAQNKSRSKVKTTVRTKAKSTVSTPAVVVDPRIEQQLQAVERVTFIDSLVLPQKEIYRHFDLGKETGVIMSARDFFHNADSLGCSLYETPLHSTIIYARPKAGSLMLELVKSDSLINEWTIPEILSGLNSDNSQNYPFLMSDGQTLYFAAQGQESIGGYDIFMTRYDADNNTWLTPQSIGMPFNSTSNDYLYIVDEYNNLGYFVTDRNQKPGDVCIYTFIPRESRNIYDPLTTPHDSLVSYAEIHRIADTWTNKREVLDALESKAKIMRGDQHKTVKRDFEFVINDRLTYTTLSQFRNAEAKKQAKGWLNTRSQLQQLDKKLDELRSQYHMNKNKRETLKSTIEQLESQQETLIINLSKQEKDIRSFENR